MADRLTNLITALTEAKATEMREAVSLAATGEAHKAQQETWRRANDALNVAQKSVDDFIRDSTKAAAAAVNDE